ncbi:anion transporter-like [Raphidocelis subcapitata]|uniref:Anion transporter-like n=1 Tax=Raphidocelis subcapitata TaxID=307507 RepID=A0A2V0PH18_9CHLO|nr:anion transporter-like [Raphidocelis subcapitata]|eukprot:GBF98302.1 anion transporter-like [Raphidocelis subcapitata]
MAAAVPPPPYGHPRPPPPLPPFADAAAAAVATVIGAPPLSLGRGKSRVAPRYLIVAACFLATFVAYVERVGFSIAFTEMAKAAGAGEALKGEVLSAFYWGYGVSQIPGGWAAQIYGGRAMLALSFALWSVASLLTPAAAAFGTVGVCVARVCVGVAQGGLIPAVHTVLSQWIPPHERARAVSLTTSGMYMGSAAAMLLLPSVAAAFGPASLLRVVGLLGLAWLALWLAVGRDVPQREALIPLVSYAARGPASAAAPPPPPPRAPPPPPKPRAAAAAAAARTPWRGMLGSAAVWAIVLNNFAFHYAFYVIMNWLPTYFNSVLGRELSDLGPLRTAPYLAMFLTSNAGGWAGDWLILRRGVGVGAARKAVNTAGMLASAAALSVMPAARGALGGVALTTATLAALGFSRGGFSVNHMDVAPKYAGVLMGISNTAGTLSGVIGVAVTGRILDAAGGASVRAGWFTAHAVAAGICLKAAAVFAFFARGERLFD